MLRELKVKVTKTVEDKTRKTLETYLIDTDFFTQAEYAVVELLSSNSNIKEYEIQSIKISSIKEIAPQYEGEHSFIATLRDTWTEDDGTEKHLRYKVLLWADTLSQANQRVHDLSREGYDMLIEGIKQVDYEYITE